MLGYLTRDYSKGLVYDGTNLNDVLDGPSSLKFKKDNTSFSDFVIPNLYGRPYHFKFPDYGLDREAVEDEHNGWKNITLDRYDHVLELSNLGYISDYTLGAHKALCENFDIYVRTASNEELYQLIPKISFEEANTDDLESEDQDIVKQAIERANLIKHRSAGYDGEMIMMKESIMDYHQPEPMDYRPTKTSQSKTFKVGEDYDFNLDKYNITVHIKDNYTAAIRYQMLNKTLEEWNANPKYKFNQRSNLLQWWQTDALKRMGRRTVILAPRRCLEENTLIRLKDGTYKKAKDVTKDDALFGDKHIKELIHGTMPGYKITLKNGMSIVVSENHRVPTSRNFDNISGRDLNEDNYKTPSELSVGDFIPVNFSEPNSKPHVGNQGFIVGFIYGMLMGDGDRNHHQIAIHYDFVREHFYKRVNKSLYPYTEDYRGYIRLSAKNKFIWNAPELKEYSYDKYIPLDKFGLSSEWKWGFVEGILITDGSLSKTKSEVEYCSTSKKLVEGLQLMLLDLGVYSVIREKKITTKFNSNTNYTAYILRINDNSSLRILLSNIDLSCKKNYDALHNIVFSDKIKHTAFNNVIPLHAFKQHTEKGYTISTTTRRTRRVFGDEQLREPLYNFQREKCKIYGLEGRLKYFRVPIKSIEKIDGDIPVVDFEVDGDHTFNAGGIQTHNSGKTVLLALEILKEMLSYNYKKATRPRSVIFISKDFDAVQQVMDYVTSLINEFDRLKGMFNYDSTNHIFSLITYDDQRKKVVIAQCKFYSALGKLPAVGDAADAVFFDEALTIPTGVMNRIMPIVTHEGARLLVVSTFYDSSDEDGGRIYDWPVKLCNEFEKESSKIIDIDQHIITLWKEKERTGLIPDECAGLRYTIDDVEVIVNKDLVKNELADEPDRYMRELYCRASESSSVLNYKPYVAQVRFNPNPYPHYVTGIGDDQQIIKPQFKRIVTAYDPAQTSDISAFLACGYEEKRNKIIVLKEWGLNFKDKSSYIPQAKLIKDALEELKRFNCPILKVADSNHPGVIDAMRGQRVFFQYLYMRGGGDSIRKGARPSETRVPKHLMVEAAQMLFDNGMVEIWDNDCKMLIEQLSNFVEFKNEYTQRSKFKGATGHDDFVDTLLYCLWTFWEHLGLSHNKFEVDNFTEMTMMQEEDEDPKGLLKNAAPKPHYEVVSNAFWY